MDPTLETVKANLTAEARKLASEVQASGIPPAEIATRNETAQAELKRASDAAGALADVAKKVEVAKSIEATLKLLGVEL